MDACEVGTRLNQDHLDRVSRSFAFCIARLEGRFRFYVGHSYLMLRVLDTIEDAPWGSLPAQRKSLADFKSFLKNAPSPENLKSWQRALLSLDLPDGEKLLIEDTDRLFVDFHEHLEPQVQESLERCALNMSRGMEYYSDLEGGGELRLTSLAEVNRYCFFVAGVVGEMLHEVFMSLPAESGEMRTELSSARDNALHLGLFLQKVNILKDQITDELEGRFLVPSRVEVLDSLKENARRGFEYIRHLPKEAVAYRVFCAWSLFLGLASLPWIQKSWSQKSLVKIPRWKTKLLLKKVERKIHSDKELSELFNSLMAGGQEKSTAASTVSAQFPEFATLYRGELTSGQLKSLGLI